MFYQNKLVTIDPYMGTYKLFYNFSLSKSPKFVFYFLFCIINHFSALFNEFLLRILRHLSH